MSFVPRKGSKVAAVIEYLKNNPDVARLSSGAIAEQFQMAPSSVANSMKRAVEGGALKCERDGRINSYSLGDDGAVAEEDGAGDTFCAALDSDGELFITGAQITETGGALLNKVQTVKLREYLLHTGSWVEAVSAQS